MLDDHAREHVRLHITPFNKDIYDRFIPPSLAKLVANVSLHTVQTFPERGFGYVDMPRTEAEKLKMKLNGSTLKGTKIRIEEARPEKKRKSDAEDVGEGTTTKRRKSGEKKSKVKKSKSQGVIAGHELEDGRHIKRAWTDSTSKAKRGSKDTKADDSLADRKLLFRTTLPPNAPADSSKEKTSRKASKEEAKKKRSGDKRSILKEFAHHRKSFALGQSTEVKPAVQYIDGEGWVDEDGKVVEAATRSTRARPQVKYTEAVQPKTHSKKQSSQSRISTAADDDSEDEGTSAEETNEQADTADTIASDADSTEESHSEEDQTQTKDARHRSIDDEEDQTEEEGTNSQDVALTSPREVHPLEALYKKSNVSDTNGTKHNLAPLDTSFSFFGSSANAGDQTINNPQTPHTKQEFEWRAQRSAAPTPDTAAIDGRFGFPFGSDEDDEDDEDDKDDKDDKDDDDEDNDLENGNDDKEATPRTSAGSSAAQPQQEESAFRKYFFEHRGENDRAWKKKRREAKKQERQRENRRLGRRVV